MTDAIQLLITPALTDAGTPTDPPTRAVIQHAVPSTNSPLQSQSPSRPRTALLPIPKPASMQRDSRTPAKTIFYKPHDIRAVSAALREIMDREKTHHLPYSQPTTTANPQTPTSYAPTPSIHYSLPNTKLATQRKPRTIHHRNQEGGPQPYLRHQDPPAPYQNRNRIRGERRPETIRTTLKCKRKKKSIGEPDKHKARAAARGDTLHRAMIKAQTRLPASYSPTIMPLTFSLFLQIAVIQKLHMATMDIKPAYLNAALPPDADWIVTALEPHKNIESGWILHKNIELPMRCMACQTLAASSIKTTRPPYSPKDTKCPHSTTAFSIGLRPPKPPTRLRRRYIHL